MFDTPLWLADNDRLVLRDISARATLAGARVVTLNPPRRGKRKAEYLQWLHALTAAADDAQALETHLQRDAVVDGGWMSNGQFLDGVALTGLLPAPLVILATFVGTWLGYMQGRFLGHTQMYHRLMSHLDEKHKEKVHYLLNKYGIITLITARYIAFVRTAYPYIVGANEIPQGRFLVVNLISSIMWICPLVGLGYYLSHTKLAAQYESQFLSIILCLPLVLLVGGLIALVWRWLSKRKVHVSRD